MAAALSARVAAGVSSILATKTAVHVQVTGAPLNDGTAAEVRYYILGDAPGATPDLRSVVFAVSHDGKYEWDGVIFPVAGAWTLRLRNAVTNADVATQAVTVA